MITISADHRTIFLNGENAASEKRAFPSRWPVSIARAKKMGGDGGGRYGSSNDEKIPEIQISVEIVGVRTQQRLDKQACLSVNVIIVSYFLPIVSTRDSTSNIHRATRPDRILRRSPRARAVGNLPSPRSCSQHFGEDTRRPIGRAIQRSPR